MTTDVVKQIRRATPAGDSRPKRRSTSFWRGSARGDPRHRTVPPRRDSTFDLLQVVQGLPGFGQKRSNPGDPTECDFR